MTELRITNLRTVVVGGSCGGIEWRAVRGGAETFNDA